MKLHRNAECGGGRCGAPARRLSAFVPSVQGGEGSRKNARRSKHKPTKSDQPHQTNQIKPIRPKRDAESWKTGVSNFSRERFDNRLRRKRLPKCKSQHPACVMAILMVLRGSFVVRMQVVTFKSIMTRTVRSPAAWVFEKNLIVGSRTVKSARPGCLAQFAATGAGVLAKQFGGRPINKENLSGWKLEATWIGKARKDERAKPCDECRPSQIDLPSRLKPAKAKLRQIK